MKAFSYQPHFLTWLNVGFPLSIVFFFYLEFQEPQEREVQYQFQYVYEPVYYNYDPTPAYGSELDCSCKRDCGYDEFEHGDCANDQTRCCKFES